MFCQRLLESFWPQSRSRTPQKDTSSTSCPRTVSLPTNELPKALREERPFKETPEKLSPKPCPSTRLHCLRNHFFETTLRHKNLKTQKHTQSKSNYYWPPSPHFFTDLKCKSPINRQVPPMAFEDLGGISSVVRLVFTLFDAFSGKLSQPSLKRHARIPFKSQKVSRTRLHAASGWRKQGSNCMRYSNSSGSLQFVSLSPRGFFSNTHRTCLFSYHVRD